MAAATRAPAPPPPRSALRTPTPHAPAAQEEVEGHLIGEIAARYDSFFDASGVRADDCWRRGRWGAGRAKDDRWGGGGPGAGWAATTGWPPPAAPTPTHTPRTQTFVPPPPPPPACPGYIQSVRESVSRLYEQVP